MSSNIYYPHFITDYNLYTTRKLINTNRNTDGIFSSVNFRFPRYIPTELPWEKNLKQSKKKNDVSFLPTELPTEIPTENSVGKIPW
jgi:hypothetical protein